MVDLFSKFSGVLKPERGDLPTVWMKRKNKEWRG